MAALPARWLDDPGPEASPHDDRPNRDDLTESRRRVTRRGQRQRRRAARRRLVALTCLLAVAIAGVAAYLLLGAAPDPYAGVWWEPSTGRRIELVADGDGYQLLYGAAKQRYAAALRGEDLVVAGPLGGDIVIRLKAGDRLVLREGGRSTVLSRLPDGL